MSHSLKIHFPIHLFPKFKFPFSPISPRFFMHQFPKLALPYHHSSISPVVSLNLSPNPQQHPLFPFNAPTQTHLNWSHVRKKLHYICMVIYSKLVLLSPSKKSKNPENHISHQSQKMASHCNQPNFHVVMFPWFAIGHMTPFLHLSNELAKRGHKISFLLPKKAQIQLEHLNLHEDKIKFYSLHVPHVEGLPIGTETASEIPIFLNRFLVEAMDLLQDQVRKLLQELNPDFVFFDFSHWVPELAKEIGFKTVCYNVVCAASIAIALVPGLKKGEKTGDSVFMEPPEGYPSTKVVMKKHESKNLSFVFTEFGRGITFYERLTTAMGNCDAISIRTCRELEGVFCDYIGEQYGGKPVILTGPILYGPSEVTLEDRWKNWLDKFPPGRVIYCAFGTQVVLEKQQFQELVLGFELTGLPFLVALRTPHGVGSIEEALPEGFQERVGERGVIYGGWVDQPAILSHNSVGCFVSHCGFGSMWESLMSNCQIVLVPFLGDQILNTRLLADGLGVAVEVARDESGVFSKEGLCKAVLDAMDEDSKVGETIREKHENWREIILKQDFGSKYMDEFIQQLERL